MNTAKDFLETLSSNTRVQVLEAALRIDLASSEEEKHAILSSQSKVIKENLCRFLLLGIKDSYLEQKKEDSIKRDELLRKDALEILLQMIVARPTSSPSSMVDEAVKAAQKLKDIC
jgi:hypothetical protein